MFTSFTQGTLSGYRKQGCVNTGKTRSWFIQGSDALEIDALPLSRPIWNFCFSRKMTYSYINEKPLTAQNFRRCIMWVGTAKERGLQLRAQVQWIVRVYVAHGNAFMKTATLINLTNVTLSLCIFTLLHWREKLWKASEETQKQTSPPVMYWASSVAAKITIQHPSRNLSSHFVKQSNTVAEFQTFSSFVFPRIPGSAV